MRRKRGELRPFDKTARAVGFVVLSILGKGVEWSGRAFFQVSPFQTCAFSLLPLHQPREPCALPAVF